MMGRDKFEELFLDDPLGLLQVPVAKEKTERTPLDQRLFDSFEEINSFYEENGREPKIGGAINEFMLASRLQGIRNNPNKVKALLPFDFYNLLKCEQTKSVTVEDILGDDPLDLLNMQDSEESIFKLEYVKKTDRIRPEYISRRNVCKNFSDYEAMFQAIHDDLKSGVRKLTTFHEKDLAVGKFFVLRGVLLYLESSNHEEKKLNYNSGTRLREDGRTRCIFDNGTESDMLYRSLYKALLKDGFGVSDLETIIKEDTPSITDSDIQNGYIYVLSSLSANPQIKGMKSFFKVGYCSSDVTERIKNAVNEPTYLMSEVRVELTVRCFNLNVPKLERTIHNFFHKVNIAFEVYDKDGNKHYPREWFIAPLSVIQEVIQLIVDDKIDQFEYNAELQVIVRKTD